jgi:hypothetical protein
MLTIISCFYKTTHNGEGLPKPGIEIQERAAGNWRHSPYPTIYGGTGINQRL